MPIDELKELGLKLKAARKEKGLTQQELSDISHVSTKQIANIERGKMNPSYLILKALAKVVPLSLDSLLAPEISPDDEVSARDARNAFAPDTGIVRGTDGAFQEI